MTIDFGIIKMLPMFPIATKLIGMFFICLVSENHQRSLLQNILCLRQIFGGTLRRLVSGFCFKSWQCCLDLIKKQQQQTNK